MQQTFIRRSPIPASAQAVFDWHMRPGAIERLTPPWEHVEAEPRSGPLSEGTRAVLRVPLGPFRMRWIAVHHGIVPGRQFVDEQERGPFRSWKHTHRFEPVGPDACILEDQIEYAVPLGAFGQQLGGPWLQKKLDRMFKYRHEVTAQDFAQRNGKQTGVGMRVLISGSTGLIGTALIPLLTTAGHDVVRLVRSQSRSASKEMVQWDPQAGTLDPAGLEQIDAVVHLAGESIADGRWTAAKKARIRDSRVQGTRTLCEALARLDRKPRVLLSGSAIGFYGNRGEEELDESSPPGSGFLAEVCREWEAATAPAEAAGIRVVHLRTGIVLSPLGGALSKMLTPFKLGAGGVLGSGRQFMSWIALDDMIGAIAFLLENEQLRGPVNLVGPSPVSNRDFTKTLGRVLRRPTVLPAPAFALRAALGEMADELLLASTRVLPKQLNRAGHAFRYPELEGALRHLLGR